MGPLVIGLGPSSIRAHHPTSEALPGGLNTSYGSQTFPLSPTLVSAIRRFQGNQGASQEENGESLGDK